MSDPVDRVWSLYWDRDGEARREIDERGWSLADVYLELGGGGPRSSELHARFTEFFNGQTRSVLDPDERAKLEYWAGVPERGAALRDRAIETLAREETVATSGNGIAERSAPPGPADPQTRSLILAHNQIDVELHAHFAGMLERDRPPPRRPAAPPRSRAVCVLGMSRSGTSVTTRILNILGVDLGDEDELMEPAAGNNPAGFWEHEGIADLNEDILATLGDAPRQRWRYPPALPEGWERDPRLEPHRHTGKSMLQGSFAGKPLWGWKDPRTCLTLPFWQQLLAEVPEVDSDLRYVICVRHPLDVAASLHARDGVPQDEALKLWLLYMSRALDATGGQPRTFVTYEDYFPGWEVQVRRLAAFLDLPPPSPAQGAAIADHVDERLRHHRVDDRPGGPELPSEVNDLYRRLRGFASQA